MKKSGVSVEQAEAWFDALGTARVKPPAGEFPAYPVKAIGVLAQNNGAILRLVMPDGKSVDLFANAVVALALRQGIRAAGVDGGWLDGEDAIIVQAPQGTGRWRPRS